MGHQYAAWKESGQPYAEGFGSLAIVVRFCGAVLAMLLTAVSGREHRLQEPFRVPDGGPFAPALRQLLQHVHRKVSGGRFFPFAPDHTVKVGAPLCVHVKACNETHRVAH